MHIQRLILLLFIIPIFFFLTFGIGFLFDFKLDESTYGYLISYIVTLITGAWAYIQLWKASNGSPTRLSTTMLYIILTVSLFIVPVVFHTLGSIKDEKITKENELFERNHCAEVITTKHKYSVMVCDNNVVSGGEVEVAEYIQETNE